MRYSATAFFLFCCYAFLPATAMEKYENPALNRVKFETPLNHRPLELVKDGKLQFAIVCDLAAEKNARIAGTDIPIKPACHSLHASSRYLQKYLERCFGEKPRILSPDSPELSSYPFKILLGKSIHTDKLGIDIMKMPPDGFKIMSYEGGIAIAGRDGSMIPGFYQWNDMGNYAANGTLCAVFDFLERFLGMRFYYPGLGVIAPKQNRLTITPVAYTDQPKYLTRSFGRPGGAFHAKGEKPRPLGLGKTSEWPWQDIPDDQGDFTAAYRMQSRPTRWMCSEGPNPFRVAGAFPDQLETCFYRDGNGRLRQSFTQYTANYFDLSNMEFSRLLAESFRKFYESKGKVNLLWDKIFCPNPEYMYFGPVDAHCVIDNERTAHLPKRKEKYAVMSEVNGQFYLDLAKRLKAMLPDKKIAFMAYSNFLAAPESVDHFPDNTRFLVCTGTPVFIRDKASEKFWKDTYSSWNRKVTEKVAPYPYDPAYNMQGGISHAIRGSFEGEYLRRMAACISDYAIFPCVYFRWDYYYSHYLTARAYWNPGFNDKAALDEHWKLLYGTAAPCLKDFYDLVITRWNDHYIPNAKIAHGSIPGLDYETLYKKAYPRDVLDRMRALLGKARTRVKKGSDEERRLNFFVMPWTRIMNEAPLTGHSELLRRIKWTTRKKKSKSTDIWKSPPGKKPGNSSSKPPITEKKRRSLPRMRGSYGTEAASISESSIRRRIKRPASSGATITLSSFSRPVRQKINSSSSSSPPEGNSRTISNPSILPAIWKHPGNAKDSARRSVPTKKAGTANCSSHSRLWTEPLRPFPVTAGTPTSSITETIRRRHPARRLSATTAT